jgi:peptidoglycan/LPS O-acetylase OafA/YrhL
METAPNNAAGKRLPSLTGMRFVAAFLVFVFHVAYQFPFGDQAVATDYSKVVANAGQAGVGFFFILSGFILTWTIRPRDRARSFWRRRAAKIYPNYVIAWVATLALILATGQSVNPLTAVANLFLLQSWVPRVSVIFSMDDVSWTLSCEALFYLSFPLLYLLISRIPASRLWAAAGVLVAAIWLMPVIATVLPGQPKFFVTPVWQLWLVYIFPLTRALDFALGMVMARVVQSGKWIRLPAGYAAVLLAGAYAGSLYLPVLFGEVAATVIPLALLVSAVAAADLTGGRTFLRNRTMIWLGEISYAFYLVHELVLSYGHRALGATRTWDTGTVALLALGALAVSVLLSWLLYSVVEVPALRRLSGRRQAVPVLPPPAPIPAGPTPELTAADPDGLEAR